MWGSGVFCSLLAAFIFAIAAVLVKLTANRVPVLEITLMRSSISLVVSVGEHKWAGADFRGGGACSAVVRQLYAAGALIAMMIFANSKEFVCEFDTKSTSRARLFSAAARLFYSSACSCCLAGRLVMSCCDVMLLCVVAAVLIKARDIKPAMGNRQNIKWLIPRGLFGESSFE